MLVSTMLFYWIDKVILIKNIIKIIILQKINSIIWLKDQQ